VAARLANDHAAVLNPDVNTPFTDIEDVIRRLLPYHVYQHPKEDIQAFLGVSDRKGKRKAIESDLATEVAGLSFMPSDQIIQRLTTDAETRFALECAKRKRELEERFRRVRYREGKVNLCLSCPITVG
jgi:hypothetical protein